MGRKPEGSGGFMEPGRQERLLAGRHPVFPAVRALGRFLLKRPQVISLETPGLYPVLYLANHSSAAGPLRLALFLPRRFAFWGIHHMCGSYRERRKYLYHVYYRQKLRWGKLSSLVMAWAFGLVSGMLYRGAEVIPTYGDNRFRKTLELSLRMMERGRNILVFPENSSEGYREMPGEYLPGFVLFARQYRKSRGEDLPICPVYYARKANRIIIGPEHYLSRLEETLNLPSAAGIAEYMRLRTEELCRQYAQGRG